MINLNLRELSLVPSLALLALVLIAAGGYVIIPSSPVFWCGRIGAYPGLYFIVGAALLQSTLYVSSAAGAYRITQYIAIPFVLWAGWQLGAAYPYTAMGCVLFAIMLFGVFRLMRRRFGDHDLVARVALGIVGFVGFTVAATQFALFSRANLLSNWFIGLCMPITLAGVIWVIGRSPPVSAPGVPFLRRCLPLTLLLLPLLRAKAPDTAPDSFLYKAVQPYAVADWRTAMSSIVDPFLIGTNFQELINANLIIWLPDYTPALLSTFSYVLLFFVMPYAIGSGATMSRIGRGILAFAGLSIFVLPEAGIDQGTSYQEPTLLFLLVSSLAPTIAWPGFLAMAVGVKVNAGFVGPLVAYFHWTQRGRNGLWWRPVAIGIPLALFVMAPQLERNVALSGRLFGLNEVLAGITDPVGPMQILASGATRYDGGARGGVLNNAMFSACNMMLLNRLCSTAYHGSENAGFHAFPGSRAPQFAITIAATLLAAMPRRRPQRTKLFISIFLYVLCWVVTLRFLSEGRYFLPLSFGFGVFVLINREALEDLVVKTTGRTGAGLAVVLIAVVLMVGSDLTPGVFANVSWVCERSLVGPVQAQPIVTPATPVEKFVAGYVAQYKIVCAPPGLSPVLLAEPNHLDSPYLGAEVITHYFGHDLNDRFYMVDSSRQRRLASAALVVAFKDPNWMARMLGPAEKDFKECFITDNTTVLCSVLLVPGGQQCAQSLYPTK